MTFFAQSGAGFDATITGCRLDELPLSGGVKE